MKFIIFSYDFAPNDGGIARLCGEISLNLAKRGYDIKVLTTNHKGNNDNVYIENNYPIIRTASKRLICEIEFYKYLRNIQHKENYVIICGLWYPEGAISLLSGFKNVFILAHGAELRPGKSKFRKKIWIPIIGNYILKHAKAVIANSNYTAMLSKKISPHAKVISLPLAVNHTFFTPSTEGKGETKNKIIICTVSRIIEFKGHDTILNAIQKMPIEARNKIEWRIAGTGPYLMEFKRKVEKSEVANQVKFYDFIKDADLPSFYKQADIFVLCTREDKKTCNVEGFGLVFLEAQSCGIPVIGTNAGGIPSAIEENNGGWLVNDADDLSLLLTELSRNPDIIREMGIKARKRILKESTWEYYIDRLINIMNV